MPKRSWAWHPENYGGWHLYRRIGAIWLAHLLVGTVLGVCQKDSLARLSCNVEGRCTYVYTCLPLPAKKVGICSRSLPGEESPPQAALVGWAGLPAVDNQFTMHATGKLEGLGKASRVVGLGVL